MWSKDEKEQFVNALSGLAMLHDRDLPAEIQALYVANMTEYIFRDVMLAIKWATQSLKFFPKIAELREHIDGSMDSRQALAWATVLNALETVGAYNSVIFEDGAIGHAINDLGGWIYLCEQTHDKLNFRKKDIERLYLAYSNRAANAPVKLIGLTEGNNARHGCGEIGFEVTVVSSDRTGEIILHNNRLLGSAKSEITKSFEPLLKRQAS